MPCKVIYDLAIYNEQNLYNLAHCDGFSGTTPPSRKRQGGVNQKPQALQACILTTPGVQTPRRGERLLVIGYWLVDRFRHTPLAYPGVGIILPGVGILHPGVGIILPGRRCR